MIETQLIAGSSAPRKLIAFLLIAALSSSTSGRPLTGSSLDIAGTSSRNATGHWIVKATVTQKGADLDGNSRDAAWWTYDLQFKRLLTDNRPSVQTKITLSAPPSPELSGYSFYEGFGFYKLYKTGTVWAKANETCEREGAHLLIINSKEEEDLIKSILESFSVPDGDIFIGIHDFDNEGEFVTVLGDPLDSIGYSNWMDSQPNDLNEKQDCGTISKDGEINDWYCDRNQPFICEMKQ